jgi:hypothetical protein
MKGQEERMRIIPTKANLQNESKIAFLKKMQFWVNGHDWRFDKTLRSIIGNACDNSPLGLWKNSK